jgi:hypothetical protein
LRSWPKSSRKKIGVNILETFSKYNDYEHQNTQYFFILLRFQNLWNLIYIFLKKLWKGSFKCLLRFFKVLWVHENQGVTFLVVPPKDMIAHLIFIVKHVVIVGKSSSRLDIFSNVLPLLYIICFLWLRGGDFGTWFVLLVVCLLWRILHLWRLGSFHLVQPPFWALYFLWLIGFKISIDCTMDANYFHIS